MLTETLQILILVQIVLGSFDMLYHHELTERLAWRHSQRHELQLHGVRNFAYGVLFLGLAWVTPHGAWAWVGLGILALELAVTLKDFVEEDRTRDLPASERVTHTVLALNFGAILVLLLPRLLFFTDQQTALLPIDRGLWSWFMTASALGVTVFGFRDLMAAKRLARTENGLDDDPTRVVPVKNASSILITGGTGFIGAHLVRRFTRQGHRVTVLTRDMGKAKFLDAPVRLITDLAQIPNGELIDTIINLAGEPIADAPWTKRRKQRLLQSRLKMTDAVVALMRRLNRKPDCLINGSAIGFYGAHPAGIVDETHDKGDAREFAPHLCREWESRATQALDLGVRTVFLRTGIVLGREGGTLARMLNPFELCLGGPLGTGTQMMSWISLRDLGRLIDHCMVCGDIKGPVNGTAPNAVTNLAFTRALARALHRPAFLRVPTRLLVALLGGLGSEIFLGDQNVFPRAALDHGFLFHDETIHDALVAILD